MSMHVSVTVSCLPTLLHRGFYPKGGGEVVVTPTPLKTLSPVCITDAGRVERVKIHAFVAGAVPPKVRIPSQPHRYLYHHHLTPFPPTHHHLTTSPLPPITISLPYPSSPKVSRQMVHSARRLIERELPEAVVEVSEIQETPATAYGNSSGIM